jgi:hypothetical protein
MQIGRITILASNSKKRQKKRETVDANRPTLVFSVHFVLTHAHPGITSRSVTHPQIAPGEFFSDELPEKKVYLIDMSILSILLSPGQDVTRVLYQE